MKKTLHLAKDHGKKVTLCEGSQIKTQLLPKDPGVGGSVILGKIIAEKTWLSSKDHRKNICIFSKDYRKHNLQYRIDENVTLCI